MTDQLKKDIKLHMLKMNKDNINILQPDYEGITNLILAFVELYEVAYDKALVDELLKSILNPMYTVNIKNTFPEKDFESALKNLMRTGSLK